MTEDIKDSVKMKALLYDMASIYQQKALKSLDTADLAHAKRYREAADTMEAMDEEIATMRYENTIRFGTSHPEMYKTALDEAKDEIARLNTEYQEACRLVAQMHLAAVGGVVGPKLGVIEDVKAMKESHDKYKALCDQMADALAIYGLRYDDPAVDAALDKYKEMK